MAPDTAHNGRPDHPLKARRLTQQLTQLDVAKKAGCSEPLVSMCESGYIPTLPRQEAIAAAVNATVGSFW